MKSEPLTPVTRDWIARGFTAIEDFVYIVLAVLIAAILLTLLVTGFINFAQSVLADTLADNIVGLLDRILLILLLVELLYTVQVSFREHALIPEPFLLIGLISAIRRVLVLTAEFSSLREKMENIPMDVLIELAVLTVLIVALVASLLLLRKRGPVSAERS